MVWCMLHQQTAPVWETIMDGYNGVLYQNYVKELRRIVYFYAKWELGTCLFAAGPQTPTHSDFTFRTTCSGEAYVPSLVSVLLCC